MTHNRSDVTWTDAAIRAEADVIVTSGMLDCDGKGYLCLTCAIAAVEAGMRAVLETK